MGHNVNTTSQQLPDHSDSNSTLKEYKKPKIHRLSPDLTKGDKPAATREITFAMGTDVGPS